MVVPQLPSPSKSDHICQILSIYCFAISKDETKDLPTNQFPDDIDMALHSRAMSWQSPLFLSAHQSAPYIPCLAKKRVLVELWASTSLPFLPTNIAPLSPTYTLCERG